MNSHEFTFIFYLIYTLMYSSNPKLIQVVAEGHGKRTDGGDVRHSLLGLYRIFREDQITFAFATKGPGRQREEEKPEPTVANDPASVALAAYANSDKSSLSLKTLAEKTQRVAAKGIDRYAPARAKKGFVWLKKESEPTVPGTTIQLLLNEETVTLGDVTKWMWLYTLVRDAPSQKPKGYENFKGGSAEVGLWLAILWDLSVTNLRKKLVQIFTAIESCTKFGLWLSMDFAWFDGNIGFKWATKDGKTLERYRGIVHGWAFYTEVTLFNLQLTLKFGALASFGWVARIWAYIFVGLATKITSSIEVSLDSENAGTEKWEAACEPEFSIGATAGAIALGHSVTALAEGRAKLTFKHSLEVNFADNKSKMETSVVLNPIVLEYRAEIHMPAFPKVDGSSNGQWYPWGVAKRELWSAKVP